MLVCSFSLLHRSAVLFNFTERSFLPIEDWVCVSFQADNLNSVSAMRVLFSKQLVSVTWKATCRDLFLANVIFRANILLSKSCPHAQAPCIRFCLLCETQKPLYYLLADLPEFNRKGCQHLLPPSGARAWASCVGAGVLCRRQVGSLKVAFCLKMTTSCQSVGGRWSYLTRLFAFQFEVVLLPAIPAKHMALASGNDRDSYLFDHVPLQHFDRWTCTFKSSHDKKSEWNI